MKAIISRTYLPSETKGSFYIMEGERLVFRCKCLELPNNGNQKNYSCIPEGVYDVEKYHSPGKGECFWVKDVPGRDSILIHKGNFAAGKKVDTQGCILPGAFFTDINFDGFIDIGDSTVTMEKLLEVLPERFKLHII